MLLGEILIMVQKREIEIKGDQNAIAGRDINNVTNFNLGGCRYIFSPKILSEIIDVLVKTTKDEGDDLIDFVVPGIEKKNQLNNISTEFFENVIKDVYDELHNIDEFLRCPSNIAYYDKYKSIVKEIKGSVTADVLAGEKLQDLLPRLLNYAKTKFDYFDSEKGYWLQVFAYYMYLNCDIGEKYDKTE